MNYWIWFANIKGLGSVQKKKLLEIYDSPEKIYKASKISLESTGVLRKGIAEEIDKSKNDSLIKRYEDYMIKHNISVINIEDKAYPKLLKEIHDPPITIFAKGNVNLLNDFSVSIVGCRDATNYGLLMSKKLAYDIALKNIVIVSGLAKGIDASAHIGALAAKGKTIAVLGCGVDIPYPKQNVELYKEILKENLVISEYLVGTKPEAGNFPARNRIISGLSQGVIVVEARENSGSIITVDFALEQGRNVYAVPGNINSQNSFGTNELIKQGAKLITNSQDVLEDMGL